MTSNGVVDHLLSSQVDQQGRRSGKSIARWPPAPGRSGTKPIAAGNALDSEAPGVEFLAPAAGKASCCWEVKAGDQSIAKRQAKLHGTPQGDVTEVGQISRGTARRIVTHENEDRRATGRRQKALRTTGRPGFIRPRSNRRCFPVPVFADAPHMPRSAGGGQNLSRQKSGLSDRAVYVTSRFADPRSIDAAARRCFIVLDGLEHALKFRTVAFGTGCGEAPALASRTIRGHSCMTIRSRGRWPPRVGAMRDGAICSTRQEALPGDGPRPAGCYYPRIAHDGVGRGQCVSL